MSKAQQIFNEAFGGWVHHHPRSDEYQAGCLYILRRKLDGIEHQDCPYHMPSAQADAWLSGCDYGHILVSHERDRRKGEAQA